MLGHHRADGDVTASAHTDGPEREHVPERVRGQHGKVLIGAVARGLRV